MEEITPEQKAQLSSWAGKRDAILKEISIATEDWQRLVAVNRNLADSNTEISNRIQQGIGRLTEINDREADRATLVRKDVADLLVEISELQTKIYGLKNEMSSLESNKQTLVGSIDHLSKIYSVVFGAVERMEGFVNNTSRSNSQNVKEIDLLLEKVRHELEKMIAVNTENVEKTNVVIQQLPRIIFDLQRDIIERKRLARVKTG